MRNVLGALAALVLSAGLPAAGEAAPMADGSTIGAVLSQRIEQDEQAVGLVVGLSEGGTARFVAHGAFGADNPRLVDEHTIFEIGSITKLFTNLLLAQMVLAGDMALDAPVAQYLPGVKIPARGGREITLFDLATHSSGLPRMPDNFEPADPHNPYPDYDAARLHAFLAGHELRRDIGAEFEYSNLGSALLAEAIAAKAGKDYETLVRERILAPLDMTDTAFVLSAEQTTRLAPGHDAAGEPAANWTFDVFAGAGALRSSAADMAKFAAAASGAAPGPLDAAFALMLARTRPVGPDGTTIGLGWLLTPPGTTSIAWHNGGTGGYRSFLGVDRAAKRGVVVLSNMSTLAGVDDIGLNLLDPTIPLKQFAPPRQVVAIDAARLDAYAGRYAITPEFVLTVTAEAGRLFVQATGQDKFEVFPEGEHRFFYRIVDAQLSFEIGGDGAASQVVLHQNGRDMPGERQ